MTIVGLALLFLAFLATADDGASTHAPALLLRAVVVALVALASKAHPVASPPYRTMVLATCVGAAAAAWGIVRSPNPWLGMQAAANAGLVALLYVSLSLAPRRLSLHILQGASLLALAHVAWAVAQRLMGVERAHGGFFSPNDLAAFVAPCAVLATWAAVRANGPTHRAAYGTVALLFLLGLWATVSRGGMLAWAAGCAVLLVPQMWRSRWRWGLVSAVPVILAAAAFVLLRHRWVDSGDPYAYSRLDIWRASWRVFTAHPWGVGLGGYGDALRMQGVPLPGWVQYPRVANNAHNEWLQALVECGVPGGLAALGAPAAVAYTLGRHSDDRARDGAVLVSFAIPALTTATLHLPPVAFLAAVWAAYGTHRAAGAAAPWRHGRALVGAAVAVYLLALPASLSTLAMDMAAQRREAHRLNEALGWAKTAVALNPQSVGAAMLEASLRYQIKRSPVDAAEELVALAERFPQSPEPPLRAAQLLAVISREPLQWLASAHYFVRAAQRDPHNALRWSDAGEAYTQAGYTADAERVYTRALQEEPHCARALQAMARIREAQGDGVEALLYWARLQAALGEAPHVRGYLLEVLSLGAP